MTLREYEAEWWPAWSAGAKPSTITRTRQALDRQLLPALGACGIDSIDRQCVLGWYRPYSAAAPGGANRALGVLAHLVEDAIERGFRSAANPCRSIRRNPGRQITRFLDARELRRLHRALDAHPARSDSGRQQVDVIRLLLLTGCRKTEISRLRWSEVAGLRLRDSKSGPRTVVLSPAAREIIDRQPRRSERVFPAVALDLSVWRSVRRAAGLEDVRLHDLRHTFASHAVMRGVPLPVVSRLLGHGSLAMTMRYAHVGDRETARAAARMGRRIERLMGGTG